MTGAHPLTSQTAGTVCGIVCLMLLRMKKSAAALIGMALLSSLVFIGAGSPAGASSSEGPAAEAAGRSSSRTSPLVALWGDSISNDADSRLEYHITRVPRRYVARTTDSSTIRYHHPYMTARMNTNPPSQAIVELGTGDARDYRTSAQMRYDIRSALNRLRGVNCVSWLNVKEHRVHPIYAGVVANAARFNRALRAVKASGDYPQLRIVDYNLWAYFNPGAFSADGLHFNSAGANRYARWVASDVVGCSR